MRFVLSLKMPTNLYRIQGPEGTIPYQQFLIDKNNIKLDDISKALTKDVRCDGRGFLTHRKLCKDLNFFLQPFHSLMNAFCCFNRSIYHPSRLFASFKLV